MGCEVEYWCIFFFKQKTAYEMRISDWSSDVCSSDLTNGRIAGISGIVGGLLAPQSGETGWRIAFVLGLLAGPLLYAAVVGGAPPIAVTPSAALLVAGWLLVGIGTRPGSGRQTGHGVFGLARLSPPPLLPTDASLSPPLP